MAIGLVWSLISFILLAVIFYLDRMGLFTSKNQFSVEGRTVLITGGSQGLGQALARLLSGRGANIVIVARNVEKLQAALDTIRSAALVPSVQRFHYISADLSNSSEAARVISEATSWNKSIPPSHVICIAGQAHPEHFVDTDPAILASQMNNNYFSAAYIAQAAIKTWLASPPIPKKETIRLEPRHLVFTSSIVVFVPIVGYSPYTPAKVAIRGLSETLSQELLLYEHFSPMRTHCVFPGTIFSPGLEQENRTKPAITKKIEENEDGQTEEEAAAEILKGLERGQEIVTGGGLLGLAMKSGSLGVSKRSGWGIVDTLLSWAVSIVLVFVRRDFDKQVRTWGMEKRVGQGYANDKALKAL